MFAQGQVYVLISRCTDPKNFELVGIPPADCLMDVVAAWTKAGLDAVEILRKSTELTREFVYDPAPEDIRDRIKPRFVNTKLVPVKNRTLGEVPRTCAHNLPGNAECKVLYGFRCI